MKGLAVALLWFGALNAYLSRYAGTCTQGSADQLAGLWLVGLAYFLALVLLWRGPVQGMILWLVAPVLPVMLWHGAAGLRFAWGVLAQGQTACTLLSGPPPFGPDGRETGFALLWLAAGVLLPALLVWRGWRGWRAGA